MLKHLLAILFLSFCFSSFAQLVVDEPPTKPPKPLTKHQAKIEEENHNCIHRNRYSSIQRLNFYPFNKASTVQIVSYDVKHDTGELYGKVGNKLPIANDTICYSQLDEIKTLSN
ncbi:MAG: hypothetical protein ABI405_07365 [Parafilimonas sp.]